MVFIVTIERLRRDGRGNGQAIKIYPIVCEPQRFDSFTQALFIRAQYTKFQ